MNQDSEIFTKVSEQEKSRLFLDLAASRCSIICKGESDQIYHFVAERNHQGFLICSIPFGFPKPTEDRDLVCNFFIGGERYFFRSMSLVVKDQVQLSCGGDIYHLQRRQNYRIKIPDAYSAIFLITDINGSPAKLGAKIFDLSSGGARVDLVTANPELKIGDQITSHIQIGKRDPLEVHGSVKHHKVEKFAAKPPKQIFGVEFADMTPLLEGKLFAITMDLHREFFSRLNTRD